MAWCSALDLDLLCNKQAAHPCSHLELVRWIEIGDVSEVVEGTFALVSGGSAVLHLQLHPPGALTAPHVARLPGRGRDHTGNFWKLKQEICKSCWTELSVRAMSTLLNKKGTPAPVSLTNADLMGCVKKQWESAFSRSNCSTAWWVTGFEPFMLHVYWQLKVVEDARELQGQLTELATGLNISNFTLNSL
eukprot:1135456-Rhodomonas_salina.1